LADVIQRRTLRWRPCSGIGLEHAEVTEADGGVRANSVIIGEHEGVGYGARYELTCDASWRTRSLVVECTDGRRLRIDGDGGGRWTDVNGNRLSQLDGCIDVDLSASPLTNTLPVRRRGLNPFMGTVAFRMVFVPFDTLEPFADGQLYTALDDEGRFRYQAEDGTFEAELSVDEDGFVISYPPLYERV
jgi:hypothetical protein